MYDSREARRAMLSIFGAGERALHAKTTEIATKNTELATKNIELAAKTAELATKTAELAAKTAELAAKTAEYTTCRYGGCREPSVFGLRCSAGHGLCEGCSEDHSGGISRNLVGTECVVQGCEERYTEASFERSGIPRDLVTSCVQRLHRDEFEREAEVARATERERRETETSLPIGDLQDAVHFKRPCCQRLFVEFTDCLAVKCDIEACGKYFCALCLEDSFDEKWACHAHTRQCNQRHFGDNNYFLLAREGETEKEMRARHAAHYETVRARQMGRFLASKGVNMPLPPLNTT